MSNLTLILIKIAYLAVLWLFVLMAVGVIRTDLFGPKKKKKPRQRSRASARPAPRRAASPRPARSRRNEPTVLAISQGHLAGATVDLGSHPILIGRAPDSHLVNTDDYALGRYDRVYPTNCTCGMNE